MLLIWMVNDNSKDSKDDTDCSNDTSGEIVIIDEEDGPQSRKFWTTAFGFYEYSKEY